MQRIASYERAINKTYTFSLCRRYFRYAKHTEPQVLNASARKHATSNDQTHAS
jgi:hypothetical protein